MEGPNEISQDVADRAQTVVSVVRFLDPECETVTRGSLYKFVMLNNPQNSHLRKLSIIPLGESIAALAYGVGKKTYQAIIERSFRP